MALPIILLNSSTGSDTQASGAGPATAIFGSANASSDGAGTTVTLPAGTDLSGVSILGDHVLFFEDATAGKRNFGKITNKAGSGGATPTVVVADAFGLSTLNKNWAIGGKRLTLGGTTSKKLFDNNSAAGDMMPGWIAQMESGYTETITTELALRRGGNTTDGPITIRGASGAGTRPIVTFSNNGNAFGVRTGAEYIYFKDFEIQNSNATKTASVALAAGNSSYFHARNVKVNNSTNKFWKVTDGVSPFLLEDCDFGYTASDTVTGNINGMVVRNCWIHNSSGHGVVVVGDGGNRTEVVGNLIVDGSGDGIRITATGSTLRFASPIITGNTVNNNTGDGLEMTTAITNVGIYVGLTITNNIFSNNGGYGINLSAGSMVQAVLDLYASVLRNNATYNNTSGAINPSTLTIEDGQTVNPTYTNTGGNDYSIGTNLKAKGYPLAGTIAVGTLSSTSSYVDPGAAQRQEAGGGAAGMLYIPNMDGT